MNLETQIETSLFDEERKVCVGWDRHQEECR